VEKRLAHTEAVKSLINEGKRKQAAELHNARVQDQFEKAKQGQTINLSDLIAAKEELELAKDRDDSGPSQDIERRHR
jgi:hypothetical protein